MKEHSVTILVAGVILFAGDPCFGQIPKLRATLEAYSGLEGMAFSPNGKLLALRGPVGTACLLDVATCRKFSTLPNNYIICVAFSPDNRMIATGVGDPEHYKVGGNILLWEVASCKVRATLTGHRIVCRSVAFNGDGMLLASVGLDGTVKLWDVKTGKETTTFKGQTQLKRLHS